MNLGLHFRKILLYFVGLIRKRIAGYFQLLAFQANHNWSDLLLKNGTETA